MVKKLLKHELYALFRVLVFLMAAVVIFAALGRIMLSVSISENVSSTGVLLTVLIIMFYVFTIIALIAAAWGLGVSRFYKSLFTGEGYMTFSLPATPMQLVWSKLLSSIIAMAAAAVVSVLSLVVFFIGWDAAFMQALGEVFGELVQIIWEALSAEPLYFVEGFILLIVSIPMSMLVVYAIISVGQLFTAHRRGMIWVIAFATYIVASLVSTLLLAPVQEALVSSVGESVGGHLSIWFNIVIYLLVDAGCFLLIRYILKNKVNLIA